MEAVDIQQLESFQAGCLFAQAEGIIPAPESCHAIAAAVREANKCKESGEEKVILFNLWYTGQPNPVIPHRSEVELDEPADQVK